MFCHAFIASCEVSIGALMEKTKQNKTHYYYYWRYIINCLEKLKNNNVLKSNSLKTNFSIILYPHLGLKHTNGKYHRSMYHYLYI